MLLKKAKFINSVIKFKIETFRGKRTSLSWSNSQVKEAKGFKNQNFIIISEIELANYILIIKLPLSSAQLNILEIDFSKCINDGNNVIFVVAEVKFPDDQRGQGS